MHDGRGFTMKLSPVRWLGRERERERVSQDCGHSNQNLVKLFNIYNYIDTYAHTHTRVMRRLTFFCGQGIFLLRLRLLQLGLVEAGHLRDIRLVRHGWLKIWEMAMRHR